MKADKSVCFPPPLLSTESYKKLEEHSIHWAYLFMLIWMGCNLVGRIKLSTVQRIAEKAKLKDKNEVLEFIKFTQENKLIYWYRVDGKAYGLVPGYLDYNSHIAKNRKQEKIVTSIPPPDEEAYCRWKGISLWQVSSDLYGPFLRQHTTVLDLDTYYDYIQKWNTMALEHGLHVASAKKRYPKRWDRVKLCHSKATFRDNYEKIIEFIPQSPFLLGHNDWGWKITFDWLISDKFKQPNYEKVLKGVYYGKGYGPSDGQRMEQNRKRHSDAPIRTYRSARDKRKWRI